MSSTLLEIPPRHEPRELSSYSVPEGALPAGASVGLSDTELRALQHNDAMAAGMIGIILGIAFLGLLSLAIAVSVWTLKVAG